MVCLPGKDPNQFDLFSDEINFGPEPSTSFPPNMQDIVDNIGETGPGGIVGGILPSPNIALLDEAEGLIATRISDLNTELAGLVSPADDIRIAEIDAELSLLDPNHSTPFDFGADPRFNPYTGTYNSQFPPLLSNTGSIQDIISVARSHLLGAKDVIPGALGSLGQANAVRALSYGSASNALQRNLGLGAIPDCGIFDALLDMLKNALQPLIDLLAALLGPIVAIIAAILAILSKILNELLTLLDILQRLLDAAAANQLLSLDPCGLLSMSQLGTPELINSINTGRLFRDPNALTIPDPGEFF